MSEENESPEMNEVPESPGPDMEGMDYGAEMDAGEGTYTMGFRASIGMDEMGAEMEAEMEAEMGESPGAVAEEEMESPGRMAVEEGMEGADEAQMMQEQQMLQMEEMTEEEYKQQQHEEMYMQQQ